MKTNTIYFSSGVPSVEVLRLSKDGISANPDIPVDDAAKFVLNAIGHNIKVLVQKAVEEEREIWERRVERLQSLMDIRETQPNKPCCLAEREACAKVCDEYDNGRHANAADLCANTIRARGNP
jgi:hypothetical protein